MNLQPVHRVGVYQLT